MPMRGELFIPERHPLYKARSSIDAWRRVLDDPDLKVVMAFFVARIICSTLSGDTFSGSGTNLVGTHDIELSRRSVDRGIGDEEQHIRSSL
jgi:hypothetical protein